MTSLEHQGEKQLFEKFWKGTFKAVATPRPESIIIASITASRKVISTETTCQPLKADERKGEVADTKVDTTTDRNGCIRDLGRHKHSSYHRTRCVSFDDDLSPRPHAPKGKKKKRKSERKRKRKRSLSYSLSPARKKKKKKKKSSKKSKRHRCTSKKTKHSSSSLKHKRKNDRKHKKSSRSHTKRRRRYRRSESESSTCRSSSTESSHHLHKSVNHPVLGGLAAQRKDPSTAHLDHRGFEWGTAAKSVCKTTPIFRSVLSTGTVLQSKPGGEVLNTAVVHHHTLTNQSKGPQDYDSGNDTSSPPSTKTSISRTSVIGDKKVLYQAPASPEKLKFTDGDNVSDSGNSVTSYASLCKPLHVEGGLSSPIFNGNGKSELVTTSVCGAKMGRPQKTVSSLSPLRTVASSRKRTRAHSSSSRSRSRSSGSSRNSGSYSRSRSLSSARSYSRSPSYLAGLRRKGSEGSGRSRGSYSRYSKERVRERKRDPSSCEKDVKHSSRKRSGKRHRRRFYSPMRKRRRDSPSHLEARRITSARKRPIPYFRPSPSSSSRSTSVSSWSSLFTRSRSPSPSPGLCLSSSRSRSRSRRRSRSRSYFSYRSYSRSSSWNSIFGRRSRSQSRSRSYDSLDGYSKGKNRH
ncbi:serine/arginine repetitive matrix protein 4 [Coregonus clupeaformis]|uniref:serine/arginine repetitive matrix protein 4 n=1 Tax=Coregonus clupeaformis TaxID=59861 RepID=UPI001BE094C8|nr:serine/arginine repetitive matrix protein 4 [Coregonus clupeaformis]